MQEAGGAMAGATMGGPGVWSVSVMWCVVCGVCCVWSVWCVVCGVWCVLCVLCIACVLLVLLASPCVVHNMRCTGAQTRAPAPSQSGDPSLSLWLLLCCCALL